MLDKTDVDEFLARLQPSVAWVEDHIEIIDQTKLPMDLEIVELRSVDEVVDVIYRLAVRGPLWQIKFDAIFGTEVFFCQFEDRCWFLTVSHRCFLQRAARIAFQ